MAENEKDLLPTMLRFIHVYRSYGAHGQPVNKRLQSPDL